LNKQNSPAYSGNVAGRRKEENEEMTETVMLATATAIPPDSPNPTQLPKGNRKKIVAKKMQSLLLIHQFPQLQIRHVMVGWLMEDRKIARLLAGTLQQLSANSMTIYRVMFDNSPAHLHLEPTLSEPDNTQWLLFPRQQHNIFPESIIPHVQNETPAVPTAVAESIHHFPNSLNPVLSIVLLINFLQDVISTQVNFIQF
jgi:hypothetical protein